MRERVRWILVTHHHIDHSAGVRRLKEATGAEVVAFGPPKSAGADWAPDRKAKDGEVIEGTEWGLEVLHTPGHASDHLCFFLEEERVLFTGDTVLSGSTAVINPPDGDMAAYLQSLERLRKRRLTRLCPGHGDVLDDPKAVLAEYVDPPDRAGEPDSRAPLIRAEQDQRPGGQDLRRRARGAPRHGRAVGPGPPAEAEGRGPGVGPRRQIGLESRLIRLTPDRTGALNREEEPSPNAPASG